MVIEITRKKVFIFLSLLIVVLAIPLTVFLSQQNQDTRQFASQDEKDLLVTVGSLKIYRSDVQDKALEQYEQSAIDKSVLQITLDNMVEEELLKQFAQEKGFEFSDDEIQTEIDKTDPGTTDPQSVELAKQELTKKKIITDFVGSRDAFDIGYWLPTGTERADFTSEEKTKVAVQEVDGKKALTEIETRLSASPQSGPLEIAKDIATKYPSIANILAVNGYSLKDNDEDLLLSPRTYDGSEIDPSVPFLKTLFELGVGEVKKVEFSDNSGGAVINVVRVNNSSLKSYNAWLNQEKTSKVKINHAL